MGLDDRTLDLPDDPIHGDGPTKVAEQTPSPALMEPTHAESRSDFRPSPGSWDSDGLPGDGSRSPGDRIDRYILLDKLGEGGMGVVYAAYDPKLDRKIALKVLPAGRGGGTARDRLVSEARAIARVSHPNVVGVHDVGAAGAELFVGMELVDGQTLKQWLAGRKRGWPQIVEMFLGIARGIAAIHEAGLVHRDVKPDNVLVDRRDRARVTDFGLARPEGVSRAVLDATERDVVSDDAAMSRPDLTVSGAQMGTPSYMAPELFEAGSASDKSDQFAYCVMLWSALYGIRPFPGDTLLELMDHVCGGQMRTAPKDAQVPDWLRRLVERGLAVDPAQRWPSMAALIEALEAGDPRAWTRRLMMGVGGLGMLGAVATGAFLMDRARTEQAVAACEATGQTIAWDAERSAALVEHFAASGVPDGAKLGDGVAKEFETFAGSWRAARTEACLDAEVERDADPELAARSVECLEEQRSHFEGLAETLGQAEGGLVSRALRSAQGLHDPADCRDLERLRQRPSRPEDADTRAQVQALYQALSATLVDEHVGTYEAGLETSRDLLTRAQALEYGPLTATAQYRVAVFLEKLGKYERAADLWRQAFTEAAVAGDDSLAGDAARVLAFTEGYQLARHDVGLRWSQLASVYHRRAGKADTLQEAQRLDVMAIMLEMQGRLDDAIAMHQRSIAMRRELAGDRHQSVGYGLHNMAAVLESLGRRKEAKASREEALSIFEAHFGSDNPTTLQARFALANLQRDLGELEIAEASIERVMAQWKTSLGAEHPDMGDALNALGRIRVLQSRASEAVPLHERALAIHRKALGDDHPDVAQTESHLADALVAAGRGEQAETHYRAALEVLARAEGDQVKRHGWARVGLGELLLDRGERDAAVEQFELALAAWEGEAEASSSVPGWVARARDGLQRAGRG